MTRSLILLALLLAAFIAPQTASADSGAVCALSFRVDFEPSGQIVQTGPGHGNCAGRIGTSMLDPLREKATIRGQARPGTTSCAPRLVAGAFDLPLRRTIDFSARQENELSVLWSGSTYVGGLPVLGGRGEAMGRNVRLTGTIRFAPASSCRLRGFGPGTIHMEALVDEQPGRGAQRRRDSRA